MKRKLSLLLVVLTALFAFTGARAQSPTAPNKTLPAPIQKVWLADQRLYIEVSPISRLHTDESGLAFSDAASYRYGEHFANRLGDIIPMRVRIYALAPANDKERKIELDFSALLQGRLTNEADPQNDPDWVLADPSVLAPGEKPLDFNRTPVAVQLRGPDGVERPAEMWDIKMLVQTKRRPEPMIFWIEFQCAFELTPNGSLDWKKMTTPDFIISQSRTADDGKDLTMGNTNPVAQNPPVVLGSVLIALGAVLALIAPLRWAIRVVRRRFARVENLDPAEKAWLVFEPLFAAGRKAAAPAAGYVFSNAQVREIVRAFKGFYGITGGVKQLHEKRFEFDDAEEVIAVLKALELGVLESGAALSSDRYAELVGRIAKLCPKP